MPNVYKKITSGASLYDQTDAVGNLDDVKRSGCLACGSGDDHTLTRTERQIVALETAS